MRGHTNFNLVALLFIPILWLVFDDAHIATRFGNSYNQIRLDAPRQPPPLALHIAMFKTGGGGPTKSKQLW